MKNSKIQFAWLFILLGVLFLSNNTFAQKEKEVKKKVVIIKETVDKDGNKTIEKIIKEGDAADEIDIEKYLEEDGDAGKEVDVKVEVIKSDDADKKTNKKKKVEVTVEGDNIFIMDGDEKTIIKIDGDQEKNEIKTEDGKHIIIMKKDGDDVDIETMMKQFGEDDNDVKKEIKIIKKRKGNGAFFGVMIDPTEDGLKLLDVVEGSPAEKSGFKKGDMLKGINEHKISSYEELTEVLSKFQPGDNIVVTYNSGEEMKKANVVLANSENLPSKKKMIWKSKDGEQIEIHEDHDIHFEEEEKHEGEKKIIKKKKKIKKKKDN